MLVHRLRRWPNVKTVLGCCLLGCLFICRFWLFGPRLSSLTRQEMSSVRGVQSGRGARGPPIRIMGVPASPLPSCGVPGYDQSVVPCPARLHTPSPAPAPATGPGSRAPPTPAVRGRRWAISAQQSWGLWAEMKKPARPVSWWVISEAGNAAVSAVNARRHPMLGRSQKFEKWGVGWDFARPQAEN